MIWTVCIVDGSGEGRDELDEAARNIRNLVNETVESVEAGAEVQDNDDSNTDEEEEEEEVPGKVLMFSFLIRLGNICWVKTLNHSIYLTNFYFIGDAEYGDVLFDPPLYIQRLVPQLQCNSQGIIVLILINILVKNSKENMCTFRYRLVLDIIEKEENEKGEVFEV